MALWALIAWVTLCAWEMSHFQYLEWVHRGGPWLLRNTVEFAAPASGALLALVAVRNRLRKRGGLNRVGASYLLAAVVFLLAGLASTQSVPAVYVAQAMVYFVGFDVVLRTRRRLVWFLWSNALLGIACAALNSVPVLHFRGILTLPTTFMERLGGGLVDIKILSFGLFGRTEWETYPLHGVWWNRLHGWSFEPIHWAYFILWTAVCCLLLLSQPATRFVKGCLWASLCLLLFHLYFVYSAAAFVVLALASALALWHVIASKVSQAVAWKGVFLALVLGVGLIGPMVLAVTPKLAQQIPDEQVFSKGENWDSKLGFVRLGSRVLTRFWPDPSLGAGAGHNLVLSTYLAFGVIGVMPLLVFEWQLAKATLRSPSRLIQLAAILSLAAINHQVPGQLFYPLGAIWVAALASAALHAESRVAGDTSRRTT